MLTEEDKIWQQRAAEFSQKEIRPIALEMDVSSGDVLSLMGRASEAGLRNWWIPKSFGGPGAARRLTSCLIGEEIAWGCLGLLEAVSGPPLPGLFLLNLGNSEQKDKYLSLLARKDKLFVGAFALTEERAGSDVQAIETTVTQTANGFVINGKKKFITHGNIADFFVVACKLKRHDRTLFKLFIVDRNDRVISSRLKTTGVRSANVAEVEFRDVELPKDSVLGFGDRDVDESDLSPFLKVMEVARIGVGAAAVGAARSAWEYARDYAAQRMRMGQRLLDTQGVSFSLVDALAKIQAARGMVHHAAELYDNGVPFRMCEANVAKLYACDLAEQAVHHCVEIVSGRGFLAGDWIEKINRDIRVCNLWEGTPNIMKISVANAIF